MWCCYLRRKNRDSDSNEYSNDYLQGYVAKNYGYNIYLNKSAEYQSDYSSTYLTGKRDGDSNQYSSNYIPDYKSTYKTEKTGTSYPYDSKTGYYQYYQDYGSEYQSKYSAAGYSSYYPTGYKTDVYQKERNSKFNSKKSHEQSEYNKTKNRERGISKIPSYLKTNQVNLTKFLNKRYSFLCCFTFQNFSFTKLIVKKIEEKHGTRKITVKKIRNKSKSKTHLGVTTGRKNNNTKPSSNIIEGENAESDKMATRSADKKFIYIGYEGPLRPRIEFEPNVPDDVVFEVEKRASMEKPFKSTDIFQKSDQQALDLSKETQRSVKELITKLFPASVSELTIARKIFVWLCSKDLDKFNFEGIKENTDAPENVLLKLKNCQTTYGVVYSTLCKEAGLMCKTISGYAKGANYNPSKKFDKMQCQHSWNAVFVDGVWRLVDCHWAARRIVGKQSANWDRIKYDLDEYYFMPNPSQLIFTHFPEDDCWQLLDNPITLAQFENLVAVKSAFFKYGLEIVSHIDAVIYFDESIGIVLGTAGKELQFQNSLFLEEDKDKREIEHCCMQSMSR